MTPSTRFANISHDLYHFLYPESALGERAEKLAAEIDIPEGATYRKVRPLVDEVLRTNGVAKDIEVAVTELLDAAISSAANAVRAERESK